MNINLKNNNRQVPIQRLLPPATKLGQGNVFTGVCDSVNRGGAIPACIAGGIPACLAGGSPPGGMPGLGGVCSQGGAWSGGGGGGCGLLLWPSVVVFC